MSVHTSAWSTFIAYASLFATALLSMGGNLADVGRVRGKHTDEFDIALAVFWPILVLLCVETFVSNLWSPTPAFQRLRWIGVLSIGTLATVSSWNHLHDLMIAREQPHIVAVLGPLAIDGFAVMSTGLILSTRRSIRVHGIVHTPVDSVQDIEVDANSPGQNEVDGVDSVQDIRADNEEDIGMGIFGTHVRPGEQWPEHIKLDSLPEDSLPWVADEVSNYLREISGVSTRPRPPRTPTRPAPLRTSSAWKPEALELVQIGLDNGIPATEIYDLLGAWYDRSPRTIRRLRERHAGS